MSQFLVGLFRAFKVMEGKMDEMSQSLGDKVITALLLDMAT
jgi:hypothetical protein